MFPGSWQTWDILWRVRNLGRRWESESEDKLHFHPLPSGNHSHHIQHPPSNQFLSNKNTICRLLCIYSWFFRKSQISSNVTCCIYTSIQVLEVGNVTSLLSYFCINACGIPTRCHEITWIILVVVTYTCKMFFSSVFDPHFKCMKSW